MTFNIRNIILIIAILFILGCPKNQVDCGTLDYFAGDASSSDEYHCFDDNMNKCVPATIILDKSYDNKRMLLEIKGLKNGICFWEETNLDNSLDTNLNCEILDAYGNYTKSIDCPE